MSEWSFRYQEKLTETNVTSRCARLLHHIPPADVLKFSNFYDSFDTSVIEEYTRCLNPENIRVILKSKTFLQTEPVLETEQYFGTKYVVNDIPEEWIGKWKNCGDCEHLFLPKPNPFIPENSPSQESWSVS